MSWCIHDLRSEISDIYEEFLKGIIKINLHTPSIIHPTQTFVEEEESSFLYSKNKLSSG
jgi:hypothetical protein